MENFYSIFGQIIFWFLAIIGLLICGSLLHDYLINKLSKKYKVIWQWVEFVFYRKKFKNWIKDKKRHPKAK